MYFVYVLQSKVNGEIYTGSTVDLRRRLAEHNSGGEISTKRYLPWKLIYYEAYPREDFARTREKRLKHNGNAIRELKKRIGLGHENRSVSTRQSGAGFTFIEVLVVFALIGIIAVFGVITSLDSYQRYNKHAERDLLVSLLEKARSEAVNNIGAQPHGIHFDSGSPVNYVLFWGSSFGSMPAYDLSVPRSQSVAITWPGDIVFTQLSGTTTAQYIIQVPGNPDITINTEGGINW